MFKNKDMQFFMENLKRKRKKNQNFFEIWSGDLNPGFSVIFPHHDLNFEGDQIKSCQVS